MNKLYAICLTILSAVTLQTNSQVDSITQKNNYTIDANTLLLKAKKQNTAAWLLMAGGVGLTTAGLMIISKDAAEDLSGALTTVFSLGTVVPEDKKDRAAGPILTIAGTGAMLGSIPLFVASGKNKRKATIMLKDEAIFINPLLPKQHLTSIGLKISL